MADAAAVVPVPELGHGHLVRGRQVRGEPRRRLPHPQARRLVVDVRIRRPPTHRLGRDKAKDGRVLQSAFGRARSRSSDARGIPSTPGAAVASLAARSAPRHGSADADGSAHRDTNTDAEGQQEDANTDGDANSRAGADSHAYVTPTSTPTPVLTPTATPTVTPTPTPKGNKKTPTPTRTPTP